MYKHLPQYLPELVSFLTSEEVYPKVTNFGGPTADPIIGIDGKKVIQMASPNYLGLANHPEVNEAAIIAIRKYGVTVCASRISSGNLDLYSELEDLIARFMNCESAIVFADVSSANRQIISQVMDPYLLSFIHPGCRLDTLGHRAIFFDNANHASLHEAVTLSRSVHVKDKSLSHARRDTHGVDVFAYRHLDMAHLEELLSRSYHETKLIVTDGYFSANAEPAPLKNISELAGKYKAMIYVDDAHGTLVLGRSGRGLAEHYGVEDEIDFNVHSLAKAGGVRFGYVAGDRKLIDYFRLSRGYLFSGATSGALVASAIAALKIAINEPHRRETVTKNASFLREGLQSLGLSAPGEMHIVPWVIGDETLAEQVYRDLLDKGVFAPPMRYPAVPVGRALIRFMPMATHTADHIAHVLDACKEIGRKYQIAAHVLHQNMRITRDIRRSTLCEAVL